MNGDPPRSNMLRIVIEPHYKLAFVAGAVAHAFGMCASGSVDMFAIIVLPVFSAVVSAFSVLVCSVLGQFLDVIDLNRVWWVGFALAASLAAIGLGLYAFGIVKCEVVPGSSPEEPIYQLGRTYWPGFFMFVFGVMHFPTAREPRGGFMD